MWQKVVFSAIFFPQAGSILFLLNILIFWYNEVNNKNYMTKKQIIIIGAGPGGLASAMILAKKGIDVTVFEKSDVVGGRNARLSLGDYHFDTGPTFLMMKFVLDQVFTDAGKNVNDYLTFYNIDPMYHLDFGDIQINPRQDTELAKQEIAKLFPGQEKGLDLFYKKEAERYTKLYPCLTKDYSKFTEFFSKTFIKAIPILGLGRNLYGNLGRYFKSEKLRLSFTFQAKYLGMSPWDCPAAFTMIPYVERQFGIFHVQGGLNKISEAMAKAAKENGAKIELNSSVSELIIENKKVKGVKLKNGKSYFADKVIINADFAYAMKNLTPKNLLKKYSEKKLAKKKYSCSTFMLYLGVDKIYNQAHHSIYFAHDYKKNVQDIFHTKKISEDTSFYIQNASQIDSTLAPKGHSTIYVLVPVANNFSNIDWQKEKNKFRNLVIKKIEERTEMKDLSKHIVAEKIQTPLDWQESYNVYTGATFNLSHNLRQMLWFRPHNKFEELDNCYLVGGGTHPGSGLPTIYESGRITSNLIAKEFGLK